MTSGFDASRFLLCLATAWIATGLAACETLGGVVAPEVQDVATTSSVPEPAAPAVQDVAITSTVPKPVELIYVPSSEPFRLGLQYFNRGNYGLAERYFRDVVEKDPNNATAWIGLAGSYDHIRRFDLADRAYRMAIKLSGETPQILNNLGYSYILRGHFAAARRYIMKAYAREPGDPTIAANIVLINSLAPPVRP